ncbi:MAG: alpha/beta fold hydrolase [Sandaracinaceae bacterium]
MSTVARGEGDIVVRTLGEGPNAVLFLHGWMVSGAVFDDVLPRLATEGRTLVVPDQRGTGASLQPASGYGLADYAADALAVLDASGVERAVIVGHSMGGQIAQYVAAHQPDRVGGLVLINPVPAGGFPLPEEPAAMFRGSGAARENQGHILDAACKQLSAESKARLVADAASVATPCIEQAYDTWTQGGFADALGAITAPALVVATDDPFLQPAFLEEHVTQAIARGRQVVLEGPGHYPLVERPAETAAVIDAFLAGVSG